MGELKYEDCLALICYLDASREIEIGFDEPPGGLYEWPKFNNECDYVRRVWGIQNAARKLEDHPHLYRPLRLQAYGHADGVAMVLMDDFEPFFELTSAIPSIEQVALAFCPTPDYLGIKNDKARERTKTLKELLAQPAIDLNDEYGTRAFELDTPLISITRFKVSGLLTLGQGLRAQRAILAAMARVAEERIASIEPDDLVNHFDLDSCWWSLLDTQGSAEVSMVIGASNLSVMGAILAAQRSMRMADIEQDDPELFDALVRNGGVEALRGGLSSEAAKANHVFAASYTTTGASEIAFSEDSELKINGWVIPHMEFDAKPGHIMDIRGAARTAMKRFKPKFDPKEVSPLPGNVSEDGSDSRKYNTFQLGRHDVAFSPALAEIENPGQHIFDFIRLNREVTKHCAAQGEKHADLIDVSTSLQIPFPKSKPNSSNSRGLAVPVRLRELSESLFGGKGFKRNLELDLRKLAIPKSLRNAVVYLYQDYTQCMADRLLFDSTLDLYDTFATLQEVIRELASSNVHLRTEAQTSVLSILVESMENALAHRIAMSRPQYEIRDMAIDFRGGLNQIVESLDVPMKCGVGIVKRLVLDDLGNPDAIRAKRELAGQDRQANYNRYSAATSLRIAGPTRCEHIRLGTESQDRLLAAMKIGVGHIFHPEEFVAYIHETAHLLHELMDDKERRSTDNLPPEDVHAYTIKENRESEVYSGAFTFASIFEKDSDLYLKHFVASFGCSPSSRYQTQYEEFQQFVEVLVWAYYVTYTQESGSAARHFEHVFRTFGPYSFNYERLVEAGQEELLRLSLKRFLEIDRTDGDILHRQRDLAFGRYRDFIRRPPFNSPDQMKEVKAACRKALRETNPSALSELLTKMDQEATEERPSDAAVVFQLLKEYLHHMYAKMDVIKSNIFVRRDEIGNYPAYDDKKDAYFQLDASYEGVVTRRRPGELLSLRLTVLKVFWDISSRFRVRRLNEIAKLSTQQTSEEADASEEG